MAHQRTKRLTKREKQAAAGGPRPARAPSGTAGGNQEQHIHCVACGRHLEPEQFDPPATAQIVKCEHGSSFASCSGCVQKATVLLAEHDRTGEPVKAAAAWH